MEHVAGEKILTAHNTTKMPRLLSVIPDGIQYIKNTGKMNLYFYNSCFHHAHYSFENGFCGLFPRNTNLDDKGPNGQTYRQVHYKFKQTINLLKKNLPIHNVFIQWHCDFLQQMNNSKSPLFKFYQGTPKPEFPNDVPRLVVREANRGGRTSLYCLEMHVNRESQFRLHYLDYNSVSIVLFF